ncbi:MAG: shikimate dehydrogenase, partial [Planctomycetaceae bacterium]|nr:shikimate dehydrogenase [Planctomycetaceae bacterium]
LGLARADAAVTISNRNSDRAKDLAEELGCQHIKWENRGTGFYDIVVNCTPLGMHPNVDETPFPVNYLREGMVVFDTVYNPETTMLLKDARDRSCTTVSGIEMFVRQAAVQYELFTGHSAPLDKMREAIREGISPIRPY